MMQKSICQKFNVTACILVGLTIFLVSCGGGSDSDNDTDGGAYTFSGTVADQYDTPLSGVRVTADGVEGADLSDEDGNFTISSPYAFQDSVIVTAGRSGFNAYYSSLDNTPDEADRAVQKTRHIKMSPQSAPDILTIHQPVQNTNIGLNENCTGEINVSGIVNLEKQENFLLDIIFVIDASGSANEVVFEDQTIFDLELKAVKKVLDKLSRDIARVGIVRFASDAALKKSLTSDFDGVEDIIDAVAAEGPEPYGQSQSGTNFYSAILNALDEFTLSPFSIQSSETDGDISLTTRKLIVLLSDGIPTLPESPGISQQKADLDASLDAAITAKEQNVIIYTYAVGLDEEKKLKSALPAISDITGGKYVEVGNMEDLEFIMPEKSLVGMGSVTIQNLSTGNTTRITPNADGLFSATMPVVYGSQTLKVTAYDFYNNKSTSVEIQITGSLTSASGNLPWGISETPVSTAEDIKTPYGGAIASDELYNLFISETGEYPDIRESIGTEVFLAQGESGETVTITGELIFKHACYNSDIGYLIIDPLDPENSALQAFANAAATSVLINTSAIGTSCNKLYATPGNATVSFSFNVTAGSYLVFYMIPNGTLAQAQSGRKSALYTLSSLNPGGFDQVLSFYSENGRRNAGIPHTILSFEDVSLIYQSDSDYGDIVFNLDGVIPWRIGHECQE